MARWLAVYGEAAHEGGQQLLHQLGHSLGPQQLGAAVGLEVVEGPREHQLVDGEREI